MIAIVSDILGNREALAATLADAAEVGATEVVCLGDVVGYGADPNWCAERIREAAGGTVLGNHDAAILEPPEARSFNPAAQDAVAWTRERLTEDNLALLRAAPLETIWNDARFVHASPVSPSSWRYVLSPDDALEAFAAYRETVCFIGHSHVPLWVVLQDEALAVVPADELVIPPEGRALVNVGSVGQPRDGDWRASYALYEPEARRITGRRVEYDLEAAATKIVRAGLPAVLARRLAAGQ